MTAFEELTRVMGRMGQTLDDRSAELVARLREKGVLDDKDWGRIHEWLPRLWNFLPAQITP